MKPWIGAPYPLLLARSVDFDPYFYILKGRYTNSIDRVLLLTLLGLLWDRAEPSGYLRIFSFHPFTFLLSSSQLNPNVYSLSVGS